MLRPQFYLRIYNGKVFSSIVIRDYCGIRTCGAYQHKPTAKLRLRSLDAVFRTALTAICDALGVKRAADDVVTHTGQVTYSSASDENNRVLLEIVADTGNVGCCFHSVGESYSRDLTKCGVRLLRVDCRYLCADAALLRSTEVCALIRQRVETLLEEQAT